MKILHLLYAGLGGHGNVFFSFVKADHDHIFNNEPLFIGVEDVRQEYVEKCDALGIKWSFIKKKGFTDGHFYKTLCRQVIANQSAVLFLHGSPYILVAKICNLFAAQKKLIVVRETHANHLKTKFNWLSLALAMIWADKLVFLSDAYNEEIRKKLKWLYRAKKIAVIPNGIDLDLYKPLPGKDNHGSIILGMQGRIIDIKDHATLMRAFAGLKKSNPSLRLKLRFAGEGELTTALQQLSRELEVQDDVEFLGLLNESELVSFLQSLDIYIHASLGETMSTAIMQAMACKLPIIASDVPGISNMIDNGVTGLLAAPKNVQQMENAILKVLTDPALNNQLSASAYSYALTNFSNNTMFERYRQLFGA